MKEYIVHLQYDISTIILTNKGESTSKSIRNIIMMISRNIVVGVIPMVRNVMIMRSNRNITIIVSQSWHWNHRIALMVS